MGHTGHIVRCDTWSPSPLKVTRLSKCYWMHTVAWSTLSTLGTKMPKLA